MMQSKESKDDQTLAKDLLTKRSIVSLFIISATKLETCLVTYYIPHASWKCFLASRQAVLYCSDHSNLLHLHWLDIFSPFPKLAIKASFAAVLVKMKLPLYHF